MVSILRKSSHLAGQLLKMLLGAFRTTLLKPAFKCVRFGSGVLDLFPGMYFPIAIYSQVLDTKINTENPGGIVRRSFGNFDHDTEIEDALDQDQISLPSDPIKTRLLIFSDPDRDSLPALERYQRHFFKALPGQDTLIIDYGPIKPKLWFDRFVSLVGFADFRNGSNSKLRGESELFSDWIVNSFVDLNLVGAMHSETVSAMWLQASLNLFIVAQSILCCSGEGSSFTIKV